MTETVPHTVAVYTGFERQKKTHPETYGEGGAAGLLLWINYIKRALSSEGLLCEGGSAFGKFGDSMLIAEVSDAGAAVDQVKSALKDCCLLDVTVIAIKEDGKWQCVHPSSNLRVNYLFDGDQQMAAGHELIRSQIERLDQILKDLKAKCEGNGVKV
jgi:hypothetical protein